LLPRPKSNFVIAATFTAIATVAVLITPHVTSAATVVALPESELASRADLVGLAAVIETKTTVRPGGGVFTLAQAQLAKTLSGKAEQQVITIEYPGGDLPGGVRSVVAGAPHLKPGDLVFGFLVRNGDRFAPWGLNYGLLGVRRDAKGEYRVSRNLKGIGLVDVNGKPIASSDNQKDKDSWPHVNDVPLNEYMAMLREVTGNQ